MTKLIKWTGSLSYTSGKFQFQKNETYPVSEEDLQLLPQDSYEVVGDAPAEEVDETGVDLTDDQLAYLSSTTVAKLREAAKEQGIDVPTSIVKKMDIFVYMLDNDFEIEVEE